MDERIRIVIIGTGKRSSYLYGPLLGILKDEVEFVGVWGRSENKARKLGDEFHVPWFTNMEQLIDKTLPQAAIVNVAYDANGEVGRRVIESGLHVLLETPIAHQLIDADAIISGAKERNLKVEVAEQYYRRPMERLKHMLIQAGVFGQVNTAYNDFMGHGYHGMSLIRSYIGFEIPIISVNGATAQYQTAPHYAWISGSHGPRQENWEQAVLHFNDNRLGVFNWTDIAYDSPLRWLRSTKFFAEKGMATGDRLTVLTPDGKDPQPIEIERCIHNIGGMETLSELVAHTKPEIVWRNPFRAYYMDDEMIAVASCLMSLVLAIRQDIQPEYGPEQARLDQEATLAMYASALQGGAPVNLERGYA